jgi:hypothetical protein
VSTIIASLSFFAAAIMAAAILSRLFTDKEMPGTIGKGTDAVANIFSGVFRG